MRETHGAWEILYKAALSSLSKQTFVGFFWSFLLFFNLLFFNLLFFSDIFYPSGVSDSPPP